MALEMCQADLDESKMPYVEDFGAKYSEMVIAIKILQGICRLLQDKPLIAVPTQALQITTLQLFTRKTE